MTTSLCVHASVVCLSVTSFAVTWLVQGQAIDAPYPCSLVCTILQSHPLLWCFLLYGFIILPSPLPSCLILSSLILSSYPLPIHPFLSHSLLSCPLHLIFSSAICSSHPSSQSSSSLPSLFLPTSSLPPGLHHILTQPQCRCSDSYLRCKWQMFFLQEIKYKNLMPQRSRKYTKSTSATSSHSADSYSSGRKFSFHCDPWASVAAGTVSCHVFLSLSVVWQMMAVACMVFSYQSGDGHLSCFNIDFRGYAAGVV